MVRFAALSIVATLVLGALARADDEGPRFWIDRLTDADWEVREEATRRLLEAGEETRAALEALLSTEDPELEHRVRFVLAHLGNRLAGPGLRLVANGSATIQAGDVRRLVLTTSQGQAGSVFDEADRGTVSFRTVFRFTMGSPSGSWDSDAQGADGMAYVLAADPRALGETGGGLGRLGIAPSVAVEFDTWPNAGDPDGNHVAIHVAHPDDEARIAIPVADPLNAGGEWWAWIDYEAGTRRLEVRLARTAARPEAALASAEVDLERIFGDGPVHHGFTAGTGAGANAHEVDFWR